MRLVQRTIGALALTGASVTLLAACSLGGLGGEAKAVADACAKVPGTSVASCECYARELQNKLNGQQMTAAAAASCLIPRSSATFQPMT